MTPWERVAIVGVGLIGGSIGKDLLDRGLARTSSASVAGASTLRTAKQVGAITPTTLSLERGVAKADLVIVCTPVARSPPMCGARPRPVVRAR